MYVSIWQHTFEQPQGYDIFNQSSFCFCVDGHLCVCPPPRLLITSGMIWSQYDWLNKFYSFYMAAIVGIISKHSPTIEAHHREHPNKSHEFTFKKVGLG